MIGGATGRLPFVVVDPESLLDAAVAAGATQTVRSETSTDGGSGASWIRSAMNGGGRPLGPWPPVSD
jgi:hypothetical protein